MQQWDGVSMDVGTAFEVGFMSTFARLYPNRVLIIGYNTPKATLAERTISYLKSQGKTVVKNGKRLIVPGEREIESLGNVPDNIMITSAIELYGGYAKSFSEAAELAKKLANQRKTKEAF